MNFTLSIPLPAVACCAIFCNASKPEIFNTNQGSQFTSEAFMGRLKKEGIQISMDGKGRWCDNVFVERFWRSSMKKCICTLLSGLT